MEGAGFLLVAGGAFGATVGLLAYLFARVRTADAFGYDRVREVVVGSPYRTAWLERLVARDAPLTLRVLGALSLGVSTAEISARALSAIVHTQTFAAHLAVQQQAETAQPGSFVANVHWCHAAASCRIAPILVLLATTLAPMLADVGMAKIAMRLLRARPLRGYELPLFAASTVVTRVIEVLASFWIPSWEGTGLPSGAVWSTFALLLGLPVVGMVSWMLWRAGTLWNQALAETKTVAHLGAGAP